jgi:hypothetical protein
MTPMHDRLGENRERLLLGPTRFPQIFLAIVIRIEDA